MSGNSNPKQRKVHRDEDEMPPLERSSESFWNKTSTKSRAMAIWTINDQKKLVSLNGLYLRMMEFHRNVHTKESALTLLAPPMGESSNVGATFDNSTILANVVTFSSDKSKRLLHPMNYTQLHGFSQQNLAKIAKKVTKEKGDDRDSSGSAGRRGSFAASSDPNAEYYWINLKDLNGLDVIANALKIHDLIQAGFRDLRAHSNMLRVSAEIFMSNIVCSLEGNSFRMYKMFFYICENVLITYEVELFPNLAELEEPGAITASMLREEDSARSSSALAIAQALEAVMSPIISTDQANSSLDNGTTARTTSTASPFFSSLTDRVMAVFFKHIVRLKRKILQVGLSYLIHEISNQMINFYDSCVEFVAFSLSYFGRVVHVNLLHRERMAMLMKIHLLSAGISLLRRSVEGCVDNYSRLIQVEGSAPVIDDHYQYNAMSELMGEGMMNHPPLMRGVAVSAEPRPSPFGYGTESSLYLLDIHDSFIFLRTCLQRQSEELKRVEGELEATIQLRTSNTNTMLSLIATTFLPLTFFAGVFGMNFTEDGGYTMDLLNVSYGPNVFVALCLASFLTSLLFFSYQGWLEFGIFAKFFKTVNDTNTAKIDDTKNVGKGDEEAIQRAAVEETRRKEESMFMRTSYSHFSSRLSDFGMSRRNNSHSQQIQNFYPSIHSKQVVQEQVKGAPTATEDHLPRESNPMNISTSMEKDF